MAVNRLSSKGLGGVQWLLLPAATVVLGLQTLRVLFPSLAWYLMDAKGAASLSLAGYAFAVFLCVFLAALLRRLAGPGMALWVTAAGLVLVRVVEQLVPRPGSDLWLSMVGSAMFIVFLPLWVGHVRAEGDRTVAGMRLAYGILLGLALDSAIKGAAGTLDLSWIAGPVTFFVVLGLGAIVLWGLVLEPMPDAEAAGEAGGSEALTLLALGPLLILEMIVLQNQGWLAEVSGWGMPQSFLAVMVGNLAAAAGLAWGLRNGYRWRVGLSLVAAVGLALAMAFAGQHGIGFLLVLVLVQAVVGWAWGLVAITAMAGRQRGLSWTTLWLGVGLILFLVLALVYYASYDLPIPIPQAMVLPGAGAILGLAAVLAALRTRKITLQHGGPGPSLATVGLLLIVPLVYWGIIGREPEGASRESGLPIRIMTYNIHSAYNPEGRQDPESIARVIETSEADIVALQEVSRGWLIDGATDLAAWLSRRLGMPYVFRGTADVVWGNAILSRFPIVDHGWGSLPLAGTLLPRGYVWLRADVGIGEPLLVIGTHLHHVESEHGPRMAQVPVLLDFWAGRPFTVLLGDMNSEPGYPEMDLIAAGGLVDSWSEAGAGDGLTWPATTPYERIDWIWHTPDLEALEANTIASVASDHLPVVVMLESRP